MVVRPQQLALTFQAASVITEKDETHDELEILLVSAGLLASHALVQLVFAPNALCCGSLQADLLYVLSGVFMLDLLFRFRFAPPQTKPELFVKSKKKK